MSAIYTGIMELTLDNSLFVPEESSGSNEESTKVPTEEPSEQYLRRKQLNKFLESCNVEKLTRPRKRWEEAGARTRKNHVKKAKGVIVAALDVIMPGDAAYLGCTAVVNACGQRAWIWRE